MILYADDPLLVSSSIPQVQPLMFCYSNVVIKRHLCNLIYVGHFIVLLSRHDVIEEMIFTHLEKHHYHSVLPANSNEK